jgi:hypothetical protein
MLTHRNRHLTAVAVLIGTALAILMLLALSQRTLAQTPPTNCSTSPKLGSKHRCPAGSRRASGSAGQQSAHPKPKGKQHKPKAHKSKRAHLRRAPAKHRGASKQATPICEDGSEPEPTEAGVLACEDGSEPTCANGREASATRESSTLLCDEDSNETSESNSAGCVQESETESTEGSPPLCEESPE